LKEQTVTLRILRFKPGRIDPPHYEDFAVRLTPKMTILDGLEQIRLSLDDTLMYRHCCHHASCGTCACTINGTPALACTTHIAELQTDTITLEPLVNYACLGDLAVDMTSFFQEWDPQWTNVRSCKKATVDRTPRGVAQLTRLENCIECGCCVAACPVTSGSEPFLGPALLAAVNNEMRNRPANKDSLLRIAADPHGAAMCRRHLICSRVCPSQVYPARHIADLQRSVGTQVPQRDSKK
jgi:succinate dehydrogenase / fumarate reductase iron-sulfur subunit